MDLKAKPISYRYVIANIVTTTELAFLTVVYIAMLLQPFEELLIVSRKLRHQAIYHVSTSALLQLSQLSVKMQNLEF